MELASSSPTSVEKFQSLLQLVDMCTKADISTFIPDKKAATNLLTFLSPTSLWS